MKYIFITGGVVSGLGKGIAEELYKEGCPTRWGRG